MTDGEIILLAVALISVIGGNELVAIAAGGMFVLCLVAPPPAFAFLDRYGVPIGVVFLTVGLLLPFATGHLGFATLAQTLASPIGVLAIAVGALSSYLAADGIKMVVVHPEVMVGLVIGSIAGVSLFGGIPVGPLVAAGLASLLYRLFKF